MRLHLPRISGRRCLSCPGVGNPYCDRAAGHTGRHVATRGRTRYVIKVWA